MGGDPEHVLEGHPQHDPQHDLLSARLAPVVERLHHMNGGPLEERHTHAGKMSCGGDHFDVANHLGEHPETVLGIHRSIPLPLRDLAQHLPSMPQHCHVVAVLGLAWREWVVVLGVRD